MTTERSNTTAAAPTLTVTDELLTKWASDPAGPVALHMKQRLLSVEEQEPAKEHAQGPRPPVIVYPPTYADIGYCIDTLADNTQVALIDSVGSQANRMEPIFKEKFPVGGADAVWLVPQIEITLSPDKAKKTDKKTEGQEQPHRERRSLLDLAHRSADAVVQSCPALKPLFDVAFDALRRRGDAGPLCRLAPTSLVFGVWDSRGGSGEKRPRLVRSVIRAWNVDVLHAAAQFNSVWKALDEDQQDALAKEAKAKKVKLSEKGFADAPAVFKPKAKVPKYLHGAPNPQARVLGGVLVRDRIERDVTVNLLALRNLRGTSEEVVTLRKYLLGLALIAATHEIDLFLREGCHLRYASTEDEWYAVSRRGTPVGVALGSPSAKDTILRFTRSAAEAVLRSEDSTKNAWPVTAKEHQFDLAEAKKLLAKKDEESPEEDDK